MTVRKQKPKHNIPPAHEMSAAEFVKLESQGGDYFRNGKYNAVRTLVDGIWFDSKGEARRYKELQMMERAGVISNLRLQVKYALIVQNKLITTYIADFVYTEEQDGLYKEVVEDFKGVVTREFAIKRKLMDALHGIDIRMTRATERRDGARGRVAGKTVRTSKRGDAKDTTGKSARRSGKVQP